MDSRIADWDITIPDAIADNGSSGLFVLGDAEVPLTALGPMVTVRARCTYEPTLRGLGVVSAVFAPAD